MIEEKHREDMANQRIKEMSDPHDQVQSRDKRIFDYYSRPDQITHTKLDMNRTLEVFNLA